MSWTSAPSRQNFDFNINDLNDNGLLDAEGVTPDNYNGLYDFTGYTITSPVDGNQYGVFSDGTYYYVPLPEDGFGSTLIPTSGTSNTYQAQAAAYLCFGRGSLISTPHGGRPVEQLVAGDPIMTSDGRTVDVKWVGHQTVCTRFGPAERLMPVRIDAGALGNGLPHTDLTVTADHGMLVDGVICHAGALVNGTTITRVPLSEMGETYTVYHIETEAHEIILANGAPAETFIDNTSRRAFDNFVEFEALYGDVPEMEELPYPRAMSARQVPKRVRALLAAKTVTESRRPIAQAS